MDKRSHLAPRDDDVRSACELLHDCSTNDKILTVTDFRLAGAAYNVYLTPAPGVLYRQRARRPEPLNDQQLLLIGVSLITGSILLFFCGTYAILISPFMPDTGYFVGLMHSRRMSNGTNVTCSMRSLCNIDLRCNQA